MRFNLWEVWKSVEGNGVLRRAVVVDTDDDRRRGKLYFDNGHEEWFLWAQLTQAGMWQLDTSPRPTRSADELKETLLQKIKSHPVCPDGMRIEIRSTSGGEWEALPSPPEGQSIAYADCIHYISTVARSLRSLYDLRLTPVEVRTGVGMEWANSGDDAANQVVRMIADRQRRIFAATQSGATDTPLPLRVPPEPTASTAPVSVGLTARTTIMVKGSGELTISPAVPDQSPAPVLIEERDGKIARVSDRDSPLSATEQDFNGWREPVLDHVQQLLSGDFQHGTNHSRVRDRLVAFAKLLPGNIAEVKERQFRIGYEIERFGGLLVAYRSEADDMPALNAAVLEDLDTLQIALAMGIDKLERWAEFRRVAADDLMNVGSANPVVIGDALNNMAAEMEKQPIYFDPELPATFRFLAEANKDPFGATKSVVYGGVRSAENLLSFLGQRALGIGKNAVSAIEQHISKAVAASLIASFSAAILAISGALPAGWAWLKPLLDALTKVGGG